MTNGGFEHSRQSPPDKIDGYVQNQSTCGRCFMSCGRQSPLLKATLQMLNRWGKDDPERSRLDASLQEITRMKDLVQMMLDLSRQNMLRSTIG